MDFVMYVLLLILIIIFFRKKKDIKYVAQNIQSRMDKKVLSLDREQQNLNRALVMAKKMQDSKEIKKIKKELFIISLKLKMLMRKYWKVDRDILGRKLRITEKEYERQRQDLQELENIGNYSKARAKEKHVEKLRNEVSRLKSQLSLVKPGKLNVLRTKVKLVVKKKTTKK